MHIALWSHAFHRVIRPMLPSLRHEVHLAVLWAAAVFAYFAHDTIVHPATGIQAWARIGLFFWASPTARWC